MGNQCYKEQTLETPIYRKKIYFTLSKDNFIEHRPRRVKNVFKSKLHFLK